MEVFSNIQNTNSVIEANDREELMNYLKLYDLTQNYLGRFIQILNLIK
jgi:hypothetical protein